MKRLPSKFSEWRLMAEAVKLDALREREELVAGCAGMLERAITEAEVEMEERRKLIPASSDSPN